MTTKQQHLQVTAWEKIEAVDEAARLARASAAIAEAEARSIVHELAGLAAERQALVNAAEREGRQGREAGGHDRFTNGRCGYARQTNGLLACGRWW